MPIGAVASSGIDELGEGEWRASRDAYDAATWLHHCSWPRERYEIGGGLWGELGAYAATAYRGTELDCIDPWLLIDAREALPMAIGHAKRLMAYEDFPGDWLGLLVGWGYPGKMTDKAAREAMATKMGKHLDALGIPRMWMFEKVSKLPSIGVVALRSKLLGGTIPGGSGKSATGPISSRTITLGGQQVLEVATGGASVDDELPTMLVLHGLGSSPSNMLKALPGLTEPLRLLLPHGGISAGSGSWSWWTEQTLKSTPPVIGARVVSTVNSLIPMLSEIYKKYGRTLVVGHSQGAILAYGIGARAGAFVDVVIPISGWLPNEALPETAPNMQLALPTFIAVHGKDDSTIPIAYDAETVAQLEYLGADARLLELDAGHALAGLWPVARQLILEGIN